MAIFEIQIRTSSFCELVKNELNVRVLPSPTVDKIEDLAGKPLEKIQCTNCSLENPSEGSGEVLVGGDLMFGYHDNLNDLRSAGSFKPSATAELLIHYTLKLKIVFDPSLPDPPVLTYDVLLYGFQSVTTGTFAFDIPANIKPVKAAIEANDDVVTIRIGTSIDDDVHATPVDRIGEGEWIQMVPGGFIADSVQMILDSALKEAAAPPPPPDPNKPWLPKAKPQALRKDGPARALWGLVLGSGWGVLAEGEIAAIDACPLMQVNIYIAVSLAVSIDFPNPGSMRTTARLTWDAESTWCDIWSTVILGVPFGIGFHIGAESAVSKEILGKPIVPGDGFIEIGHTDTSVSYQRMSVPPAPSSQFVRSHAEVTMEGIQTGGSIKLKVGPELGGKVISATTGLHIDCNLRGVSMVFNPAQVVLGNVAAGYIGQPPRVFLQNTVFEPAEAWAISTDLVDMSDPHSKASQTVLTFIDPPLPKRRLPPGTATSVFLFTDYGVRWVDLGTIPEVPTSAPVWANGLMNKYCDSLNNPWVHAVTQLGWEVDPLVDPDFAQTVIIDPLRLWSVGLVELPESARIEFFAAAADGSERLLGIVQRQRSAALQIVTDANEMLTMRVETPFTAPAPRLTRSWMLPFAAHPLDSEPAMIAAMGGLLLLTGHDGVTRTIDPRDMAGRAVDDRRMRKSNPRTAPAANAPENAETRGHHAWGTATRLDKHTIAITHRGQLLIGTVGTPRRVR